MVTAAVGALLAGAPAMAQDAGELAGAPGYRNEAARSEQALDAARSEQAAREQAAKESAARAQILGDLSFRGQPVETNAARSPQDEAFYRGEGYRGDLSGIVGLRVDAAKDTLRRRGYSPARSINANGRQYDLWSSGRACVGFASYNGRVTDLRDFREAECGFDGGYDGGWGNGGWGGGGRFDVRDLEGLRVDTAKDVLRREGFRAERSIRYNGRQYDLWSNGRDRRDACVGFASYNGRVNDARTFRDAECGGFGGGGPGGPGGGWGRFEPRDLEGLGVERAQEALRWEGFRPARSIRISGRQYDLWYSRDNRNACVGFTSYYGRVTQARRFDERDCY